MKVWTQVAFDKVKPNDAGIRVFNSYGDFTRIQYIGDWCSFGEGCIFGKSIFGINCGFDQKCTFYDIENSKFGEGCCAWSPFWNYVFPPLFKTIGPILPTRGTYSYWKERLDKWDLDISGCYDDIEEQIKPHLAKILRSQQWTKCERRILESWKGGDRS